MKVLITGAGGFIGQAVTSRLLEEGYTVAVLVRSSRSISFYHPKLEWLLGDMRDKKSLVQNTKGVDVVVHLAAAKSDERESYEINVTGAQNLLEACETNGVKRIINISTISTKLPQKGVYAETKEKADEI